MAEDLRLITSRRSYEFATDDLRLSLLCLPQAQERIVQAFAFQAAVLATPQQTFGPVLATVPPGFVLNVGVWQGPDGAAVPIRLIHFEPVRIVIDVAGPSSAIDSIFDTLRTLVGDLTASDGSPAIGEVKRVLDYSEYSGRFPFDLDDLFAPQVRDLLRDAAGSSERNNGATAVVPSISMLAHRPDEEFTGMSADSRVLTVTLRAGTRPEERVGFSGAPLDSEAHRGYIARIGEVLARQRH